MGFENTKLWELFTEKTANDTDFQVAVKELCAAGEALAKTIITFFPTFTLHDGTHIEGVCSWMTQLLGERANDLTAENAALLLLGACWHDSGMSVDNEEKTGLAQRLQDGYPEWHEDEEWFAYFERHPGDAVTYNKDKSAFEAILRNFIREHHHERARIKIKEQEWKPIFPAKNITSDLLADLCESHGNDLKQHETIGENIDFELCAVLLRLADILDYDASRAPDVLFRHLGLDHPQTAEEKKSSEEFQKNSAGIFTLESDHKLLHYTAKCSDPNIGYSIRSYLEWVEKELDQCRKHLDACGGCEKRLVLPYEVRVKIQYEECEDGDFSLSMDQDKIISLLAGEKLYSDSGVFVRELLQNAIDAVLDRVRCDSRFTLEKGKIDIYTWTDQEGYVWFRIEDNGTGMDEHILRNYSLKVGRSYYTSDEYQKSELSQHNGFKPTSRFGIGILSCFLSDQKRNQVRVETKRYSQNTPNPNPVLRLFVPKLHGFYFLLKGKKGKTQELQIPVPPGEKETERTRKDPGTTICVRVSQFRMGGKTFRKLLDEYIVYPEVRVVHHDCDRNDEKKYTTQAELMTEVDRLLGGKTEKEFIHRLPVQHYEEIKQRFPKEEWTADDCPELVLTYRRLDTLSPNTAGLLLKPALKNSAKIERTYRGTAAFGTEDIQIHFGKNDRADNRIADLEIPNGKLFQLLTEEEKAVWKRLLRNRDSLILTAYNGVLAAETNRSDSLMVLLLRGSNYPEVDMARETLRSLPLDTCCELEMQGIQTFALVDRETRQRMVASEYIQILNQHPDWEQFVRYQIADTGETVSMTELREMQKEGKAVSVFVSTDKAKDLLALTALKRYFAVDAAAGSYISIKPALPDELLNGEELLEFPPHLFLNNRKQCERNCHILRANKQFYNPAHPFAQWLIENRAAMQETVPDQYAALLWAMLNHYLKDINQVLHILRGFRVLPFDVPADLTREDFDSSKWFSE